MSSRDEPPHVQALASRYPAIVFRPYPVEPDSEADWPRLARCTCGLHLDCPNDLHFGPTHPCDCSPGCVQEIAT